ncbi:MAG: B12-binding domain-containing radical SAM protein, partial [Rhodoplanes sp.]
PYQCSFCTIINVQGRVSRRRSPDDVERIVRENIAQGLSRFFITDDNFARNKDWESILDRLIYLREVERMDFSFIIQVDTLCHRTAGFIEKCRRAGVKRVFIGLENINPDNLAGAKKKQNKITEYRTMLLAWQHASILTYAGYIIGFPGDTAESVGREIEIIKRELPVDVLEFFYLTPLPGSEDHQKLYRAGVWMDPDLNKYDLFHITTAHPRMSREEWTYAYQQAWKSFYSTEHVTTVMRRAAALHGFGATLFAITWFKASIEIENVHPLEAGFLRLKFRRDRRATLPRESIWAFYPKFILETLVKNARWVYTYLRLRRIYLRIKHDPKRYEYRDLAITPVTDDEGSRELFQNAAAQAYVDQERRLEKIRRGEAA